MRILTCVGSILARPHLRQICPCIFTCIGSVLARPHLRQIYPCILTCVALEFPLRPHLRRISLLVLTCVVSILARPHLCRNFPSALSVVCPPLASPPLASSPARPPDLSLHLHLRGFISFLQPHLHGLRIFCQLCTQPEGPELSRALHQGIATPHEHVTDVKGAANNTGSRQQAVSVHCKCINICFWTVRWGPSLALDDDREEVSSSSFTYESLIAIETPHFFIHSCKCQIKGESHCLNHTIH